MNDELRGGGGTEGGTEAQRFWEGHYQGREKRRGVRPGSVFVEIAEPLLPGTALDLGCGEGGDAIWLARRGWRVTAVDVSATALERASEHATEAGVADRIDFRSHDLTRTFPEGSFDLVSAQYLHAPMEFPHVLRTAARAVAPGGLLLVVDHGSVAPWSWADPDTRFPAPEEVLSGLDLDPARWRTERADAPRRRATGPNGETAAVTDNVLAVRRLVR